MEINFSGKKTYVLAIALICYAVGGAVAGYIELPIAIEMVLGALGFITLRHGITTTVKNEVNKEKPE
tara:strand:+ start:3683 stop:3883 length:201 start_codon:yes stop_codon:yes gene_type:complete